MSVMVGLFVFPIQVWRAYILLGEISANQHISTNIFFFFYIRFSIENIVNGYFATIMSWNYASRIFFSFGISVINILCFSQLSLILLKVALGRDSCFLFVWAFLLHHSFVSWWRIVAIIVIIVASRCRRHHTTHESILHIFYYLSTFSLDLRFGISCQLVKLRVIMTTKH